MNTKFSEWFVALSGILAIVLICFGVPWWLVILVWLLLIGSL